MAPEHGTELAYVYADWFGSSGVRAPVEDEIDWEFAQVSLVLVFCFFLVFFWVFCAVFTIVSDDARSPSFSTLFQHCF